MKNIRMVCLILTFVLFPMAALGELEIAFLDVGQGDSSLIVCDGAAMLIDGGTRDDKDGLIVEAQLCRDYNGFHRG